LHLAHGIRGVVAVFCGGEREASAVAPAAARSRQLREDRCGVLEEIGGERGEQCNARDLRDSADEDLRDTVVLFEMRVGELTQRGACA
jgi:hypothetical protein